MSAAALASKATNKIVTYDIKKCIPIYPLLPKTKYKIGDVRDENLLDIPFMFFDVEHDG